MCTPMFTKVEIFYTNVFSRLSKQQIINQSAENIT